MMTDKSEHDILIDSLVKMGETPARLEWSKQLLGVDESDNKTVYTVRKNWAVSPVIFHMGGVEIFGIPGHGVMKYEAEGVDGEGYKFHEYKDGNQQVIIRWKDE